MDAANAYNAYLTDEIRVQSGTYARALSGTPQAMDKQKQPFIWRKDRLAKRLACGMLVKNSPQKLRLMWKVR